VDSRSNARPDRQSGVGAGFARGPERPQPDAGEGTSAPRKIFRKFDAPRGAKPFGAKPFGAKPFGAKPSAAKPFGGKPFSGSRSGSGPRPFDGERPKRSLDGPRPERSGGFERSRGEGRSGFGSKPGGFSGQKPSAKHGGFAAKGGPFTNFADGKKPFRGSGAARKSGSGSAPTSRRRNEGGQ
jgi:23S rRNA pseudouridine2605 synthase